MPIIDLVLPNKWSSSTTVLKSNSNLVYDWLITIKLTYPDRTRERARAFEPKNESIISFHTRLVIDVNGKDTNYHDDLISFWMLCGCSKIFFDEVMKRNNKELRGRLSSKMPL